MNHDPKHNARPDGEDQHLVSRHYMLQKANAAASSGNWRAQEQPAAALQSRKSFLIPCLQTCWNNWNLIN